MDILPPCLWRTVLKHLPLKLEFLLISKDIKRTLLEYYTPNLSILWSFHKDCYPSLFQKLYREVLSDSGTLYVKNNYGNLILSTYNECDYESSTIDKDFRRNLISNFLDIFRYSFGLIPVIICGSLIGFMDEDTALEYAPQFYNRHNKKVFKVFAKKFPKCLNHIYDPKFTIPSWGEENSYRSIIECATMQDTIEDVKMLVDLGADINRAGFGSFAFDKRSKYISFYIEMGLHPNTAFNLLLDKIDYPDGNGFCEIFKNLEKTYKLLLFLAKDVNYDYNLMKKFWRVKHVDINLDC